MRVTINVSGIHQVATALRSRAATLKGLAAGIEVLNRAAKAAAPRSSGTLIDAQEFKVSPGSQGQTRSYAIQGTTVDHGRIVQRPGRGRVYARPGLYDLFVRLGTRPRGNHPGTSPNDYRRRATLAAGNAAAKLVLDVIGEEVRKLILAARV